ncbi:MAG: MATE family efflux transporter [Clostridium sp.]
MIKIDLTKGNVGKVIIGLALPIMGSSMLQLTYNLVDMIWVGALGSNAVASLGTSSFFIGLGYSISSLVVIGAGIKVAHAIGRDDDTEVNQYINCGNFLNLVLGGAYCLFLVFMGKDLISFFSLNNPVVERDAYIYLAVNGPVLFFAFFNLMYIRVLGSFGNNKTALKISAVGIVLNIVLDPILIYTFKLGVAGASVASLIANIVMFLMFSIKGKDIFRYHSKEGLKYKKVKEIFNLGFPMAFQRVLFTLVNIILARHIAIFGSDAIAAQKIGLQVESITYMVVAGLNGAISSFTGQNYGAKQYGRINKGYKVALFIGAIYSGITSFIFIVFPELLVRLFIRENTTIVIASSYLRIIGTSQIFNAVEMISNGVFTGIGLPKIPAVISIIFTMMRIPMALILIKRFGVSGVWWSIAISSILKGIVSYGFYKFFVYKRIENRKSNP